MPRIIYKFIFYNPISSRKYFRKLEIFAADAELKNLYELPLGNVSRAQVCLGDNFHSPWPINPVEIEDYSNKIISYFWNSTFNCGYKANIISTLHFVKYKTEISNPEIWQQKTKENPDWIPDKNDLLFNSPYNLEG